MISNSTHSHLEPKRDARPDCRSISILYLSAAGAVGGGNRSLLAICHGMKQRQHRVAIAVPEDGKMTGACAQAGIDAFVHPHLQPAWRHPWRTWRAQDDWKQVFQHHRPDLVHANELLPARSIMLAAHRAEIPVACHIRFPPPIDFVRWAFRRLPRPDAFIFNSHALREEVGPLIETACPRAVQHVVHNALDTGEFFPSQQPTASRRVGIVANLIPFKGHQDFLQMARLLEDRGVDGEYWVIGADIHHTGYGDELRRQTAQLGLEKNVRFLGHCNNVADLIRQLDIVVCSSHVEPFGRCAMEAMACGKPVVCTNVGGLPEVVGTDGSAGVLVQPRAPSQLAQAVESLFNDQRRRLAMALAGRNRVQRLFSLSRHTENILEIYNGILAVA